MSKQSKANNVFINMIVSNFFTANKINTIASFCEWIVKQGIIPEYYINNFLAVSLYNQEIQRTKTAAKPRGVKWIAEINVLNVVPISSRKLHNLLKCSRRGHHGISAHNLQNTTNDK